MISRRDALSTVGVAAAASALSPLAAAAAALGPMPRGRLRQSVARWCYSNTKIHDLCAAAKSMGLVGVDLLGPEEWDVPKQYGLECTMGNSWGTIPVGFNRLTSWSPTANRTSRRRPRPA